MKKIFVIVVSMIIVVTASAQHRVERGHYYSRPRTSIVVSSGYYPYYSPFYPYDYGFYHPYYNRPSRLELQIGDIKSDYSDRIYSVRHDDKLSRREKKDRIHELKSQRDQAIRDAERNYYRSY